MKSKKRLGLTSALSILCSLPLWTVAPALGQPDRSAPPGNSGGRGPDDPAPPAADVGGPTVPDPHVADRKHNHRELKLGPVEPPKYLTQPLPLVTRASSEDKKQKRLKQDMPDAPGASKR